MELVGSMGRGRCLRIKDIERAQNFFRWPEKKHLCLGFPKKKGSSSLNLSAGSKNKKVIFPAFVSGKSVLRPLAAGRRLAMS
jgi:hypothetical protein